MEVERRKAQEAVDQESDQQNRGLAAHQDISPTAGAMLGGDLNFFELNKQSTHA